jgi:hypothetical protein
MLRGGLAYLKSGDDFDTDPPFHFLANLWAHPQVVTWKYKIQPDGALVSDDDAGLLALRSRVVASNS